MYTIHFILLISQKCNNDYPDAVQLWDLKKRQLKTIFKSTEAARDPHTHSPAGQGDLVTTVCFMPTGELVCSGDQVV